MATIVDPPAPATSRPPTRTPARVPRWRQVLRRDWRLLAVAGAAVLVRLPFLLKHPGSDESGFSMVASQWHSGSGALYGGYWVDRPPLLFVVFGLADLLGGLGALRVIGAIFVAAAIYAVARTVRVLVHGTSYAARAELWAALTAAAFLCCAMLGTFEVNGELLSTPFVAAGIGFVSVAVRSSGGLRPGDASPYPSRALWQAGLGGACGMVAVLIKQNFVDVFVFAAAALIGCAVVRRLGVGQVVRLALAGLGGATVVTALTALVTVWNGTSLSGVLYAMYPFRIAAGIVTARFDPGSADARGQALLVSAFSSGLVPLLVLLVGVLIATRPRNPLVLALMLEVAYCAVSIAMGGSYWLHYLIQLVVPTAMLVGVVMARGLSWMRIPVGALIVLTLAYVPFTTSITGGHEGDVTGSALRRAGQPGDTIVTIYGHAEVDYGARMASPYQHLWSLPIRTLDPDLTDLQSVLAGNRAPTWFVAYSVFHTWGVNPRGADRVVDLVHQRYHKVAVICGHTIYLRKDADRPTPKAASSCSEPNFSTMVANLVG